MNANEDGCAPVSLDGDRATLRIRCGSDIRDKSREAGITGDFLEYSDPVFDGPLPDVSDLLKILAPKTRRECRPVAAAIGENPAEGVRTLAERIWLVRLSDVPDVQRRRSRWHGRHRFRWDTQRSVGFRIHAWHSG